MEFSVKPKEFLDALKRLLPHPPRLKLGLRGGPKVMLTADGDALVLTGQFENVWSIPVVVQEHGVCAVDLKTLIAQLRAYNPNAPLSFALVPDGLKFGTTKLKLHDTW